MSRAPSGNRGGDTPREAWHALHQVFFISPLKKVGHIGQTGHKKASLFYKLTSHFSEVKLAFPSCWDSTLRA